MISSSDILADLWTLAGGAHETLARVTLTGAEPMLPSNFRLGVAAQVSIAAAGLAAAEISRLRSGQAQHVTVDMRHAIVECRSERYLRCDGEGPPPAWDALAGIYTTADGRFVRLHTNFPHHRAAIVRVLGCDDNRDAAQAALSTWPGEAFETAANESGGVVALMRTRDEWLVHPQGQAIAALPVLTIEKIGDAPRRPWPAGARPLEGLRVLDLSRVIAGPVAGRTLAAHGADVLLIASPDLPVIPWLTIDTGRGKLSAHADLDKAEHRDALRDLIKHTDIFSQGYRPSALAARGFAPHDIAVLSPGIVCISLSAYGSIGPWKTRRGFDSLVQTATGFNAAAGRDEGHERPKELPAQILDHATGHLMAFGAKIARLRQAREGGSWHVLLSLAQTGNWLWNMGRLTKGVAAPDLTAADIRPFLKGVPSGFGALSVVTHAAELSVTPAYWARPSVPLGSDPARWPDRA